MQAKYVFELTDKQREAVNLYTTLDRLSFDVDGCVHWTDWREHDVSCYTFHKDGTITLEQREFFDEGWSTYLLSGAA